MRTDLILIIGLNAFIACMAIIFGIFVYPKRELSEEIIEQAEPADVRHGNETVGLVVVKTDG
jgi:hypothetical protein